MQSPGGGPPPYINRSQATIIRTFPHDIGLAWLEEIQKRNKGAHSVIWADQWSDDCRVGSDIVRKWAQLWDSMEPPKVVDLGLEDDIRAYPLGTLVVAED